MKYDKNYLKEKYAATCSDDGSDNLETYKAWLERQLINRLEVIDELLTDMHVGVFDAFHEVRRSKGNTESILVNGMEITQMIVNAKLSIRSKSN